jgi:hypothetical protein
MTRTTYRLMIFSFLAAGVVPLVSSCSSTPQNLKNPDVTVAALKKISFSEDADVREAVREECQIQTQVPEFLKRFGREYGVKVTLVDSLEKANTDQTIEMEITRVHAPGGGGWSGAKSVTVKAKVYENGSLVGDATATRHSSGGMFAGYKGTCAIVGRCAEAIGQDLARWLQDPSKDARLGDL